MASLSVVTIGERELEKHLELATAKVVEFSFRPAKPPEPPAAEATLGGRRVAYRPLQSAAPPRAAAAAPQSFRLAERIREITPRDELPTDVEHHVLRVVRRGVQVYVAIYELYEQASGLDRLKAANERGELGAADEAELREKIEAACAASLFAFCAYLVAQLQDYQREAAERVSFELEAPGEVALGSRLDALHAGLHQLWRAIDAHARDDASLVKAVLLAARDYARRIGARQHSLPHLEFYTRYHYRIEPEGVAIAGFELPEGRPQAEIQVPEKRPEEVVGNHVAKLEAQRIAQRLACYDLERRRNPFVDLGGFVFTFLADGSPGTGKTTLIQMMVTLLREYTQAAGLPLRYQNFSVDEISDYQGRSGQNARRFCDAILDPRVVGFGTVDDVDQVCGNRNDRNASAGQLEVTAVFMQQLSGAGTIVRGNATFGLFSNYPEKVDDALRQRAQARLLVDGPKTREDFTDLLHLLLQKHFTLELGAGYRPLETQRVREVIREKYGEHGRPSDPELRRLFEDVVARAGGGGKLASWRAFGEYLHALGRHDARFTGRAVRNVADAVLARMMDFDLPPEWLEKREVFFGQPYERKLEMLRELRGEITPEIVIQEINRYADSEARYAELAEERAFEERTRQIALEARARKAAAEREDAG
jgi:hypothetical protein